MKKKQINIDFAGYKIIANPDSVAGTIIERDKIDLNKPGDYGCDPLGDGTFRMVPSGDIVDLKEMQKRLNK